MRVAKADGELETFDPHKLRASLKRSGAEPEVVESIALDVERGLYEGIPTHELYAKAFKALRSHKRHAAARYSLKRAVLEFGPSGFPFEAYLGELFRAEKYTEVAIDQIVRGACVEHEVDVVYRDGEEKRWYVEAKFHNSLGFKTDLKTVLYVKARIDDIRDFVRASPGNGPHDARGLVVTNTKFTSVAVIYAQCKGLELLGWDYPLHHTLHERIDRARLYPITALTTLSRREKMALLSQKKVLCSDIVNNTLVLGTVGVVGSRAQRALAEVGALCVPGSDI
jgi:hypothetical protein